MLWLTADTHFGCKNLVSNSRKVFSSIEEHDAVVMDTLNRYVEPNDRLVIIGDFCKEKPGRYRQHIRCKNIFYVLGNHDREPKIRAVFGGNTWTQKMVKLSTGDRVLCAHHPQCFWDRSHYGVLHAYGHLHWNLEREAMMDLGLPGRRSHDVGVDVAYALFGEYRPISEPEFLGLLKDRPGHDIIRKEDRWEKRDYEQMDGGLQSDTAE